MCNHQILFSKDLMQDIQSAIFYWHWDEDVKKKLPMAPLINDDFTLYLQLQSAMSRSILNPEAVEKLKRELPPIPEGKLDARESWDNYFKFRKEYAINKRMAQRQVTYFRVAFIFLYNIF